MGINLKVRLSFAKDFWLEIAIFAVSEGTGLLFIMVIFTRIKTLNGWSLPEMIFLHGLFTISMSVYRILFQGIYMIPFYIQDGSFDLLLIRPRSPLLQLYSAITNIFGAGNLVLGTILIIVSSNMLSFNWTFSKLFMLVLFIILANAILIGIVLFTASLTIWFVRLDRMHPMIYKLWFFCKYPLSIYPAPIKILLTFIVPLGFTSYYPARYLLAIHGNNYWIPAATIGITLFLILGSRAFFYAGIKHYTSTGS